MSCAMCSSSARVPSGFRSNAACIRVRQCARAVRRAFPSWPVSVGRWRDCLPIASAGKRARPAQNEHPGAIALSLVAHVHGDFVLLAVIDQRNQIAGQRMPIHLKPCDAVLDVSVV